ncbi:MAG: MFS transporter [Rhizobiaceae bacterium]|nr:MFS transporter [Rhizobiaceae bacterium]
MIERTRTVWLVVLLLFGAGLFAAMQFAKLAPVMADVRSAFGLSAVGAGFAVSVLGLVGLVFGVAAGALVAAIGQKRAMMIALFGGALAAALGAMATNGPLFLATRLAEGASHLLIVVAAPALMTAHATRKDTPFVLALWGCFFGIGIGIVSQAAPFIVAAGGWRALMGVHAALVGATGVALAIALRRSGHHEETAALPRVADIVAAHARLYASGAPFLLAMLFAAYTLPFLAVLTFLNRHLIDVQGWDAAAAGTFIAAMTLVNLAATLATGWLVGLGMTLRSGMVLAFVTLSVATAMVFTLALPAWLMVACVIAAMAAFGLMPGLVFVHVPKIAPTPALAAMTYGGIAQFGNLGTFSGTPLMAAFLDFGGWPAAALLVALVSAAGIGISLAVARAARL